MERRALAAEAPTLSALTQPTSATPVLFVDMTPCSTTLTVPTTGIYDIVALRAQGSHGIADKCGDGPKVLMCRVPGIDGGAHVD
jgi:hypothetical protein